MNQDHLECLSKKRGRPLFSLDRFRVVTVNVIVTKSPRTTERGRGARVTPASTCRSRSFTLDSQFNVVSRWWISSSFLGDFHHRQIVALTLSVRLSVATNVGEFAFVRTCSVICNSSLLLIRSIEAETTTCATNQRHARRAHGKDEIVYMFANNCSTHMMM